MLRHDGRIFVIILLLLMILLLLIERVSDLINAMLGG